MQYVQNTAVFVHFLFKMQTYFVLQLCGRVFRVSYRASWPRTHHDARGDATTHRGATAGARAYSDH